MTGRSLPAHLARQFIRCQDKGVSDALNRSIEVHTCRQQHVVIRFILEDMPDAEPIDAYETWAVLHRLRDVLIRHLKLEDLKLYPALQRSSDSRIREIAIRYQIQMGGLRAAFDHFCDRWSNAKKIAENPRGFLSDWETIRDPLMQRMDEEDRGLYEPAQAHFDRLMRRPATER